MALPALYGEEGLTRAHVAEALRAMAERVEVGEGGGGVYMVQGKDRIEVAILRPAVLDGFIVNGKAE